MADPDWFIAFTNPRSEELLKEILKRRSFETYLPVMTVTRRRTTVGRPLFPRYVFLGLKPEQQLFHLRGTPRLEGVVKVAGRPHHVAPETIDGLRAAEAGGVYDFTAATEGQRAKARADAERVAKLKRLVAGASVRIVGGPFKLFPGTVHAPLPPDRVSVTVSVFGRGFPVPMMLDDVELMPAGRR